MSYFVFRARAAQFAALCGIVQKLAAVALSSVLAMVLFLAPSTVATAAVKNWNAGDGNWSFPFAWFPSGVPVAGDTVNIGPFGNGFPHTITYDYPGAVTLNSLKIDDAGATTTTLSMSANILTSSTEWVGVNGRGTIDQSGGTNTIAAGAGFLDVGVFLGSTGIYNLSGTGALVANTPEYIGDVGTGFFNQTGGSNTINAGNNLYLGYNASNTSPTGGTYTLSSGSLAVTGGTEYVGYNRVGMFTQSGGTNTVAGSLLLGNEPGSTGTYTLSGGSLSVSSAEQIGRWGTGNFNQTGGTNDCLFLTISVFGGLANTYTLSGGSATIGNVTVGQSGPGGSGVLTVSGTGVLTVGDYFFVANTPGTFVNLSGGTINTGSLIFEGGPTQFNWTSGKLNLTSSVTWDSAAIPNTTPSAAFGSALALGSDQTLMITGNETLGGAGAFALTLDSGSTHDVMGTLTIATNGALTQNAGSTLNVPTIIQGGGVVNGTLQNQTTFTYQSGLFNGRLVNQGAVNFGSSFTAGNGVQNDTSMTVASGQTLTANGAGFDNRGTLLLNDATAVVAGTTLDNTGLIRGEGLITAPFHNQVGGELRAEPGKSLTLTGAGNTNAGRINLLGGVIEFTESLTNNAGALVSGNGTLITGNGLLNQGVMNFGGTANVLGDVTNSATGRIISAGGGATIFFDDVANQGEIRTSANGFTIFFGAVSGAGTFTGTGTVNFEGDLTPGNSAAAVSFGGNVAFASTSTLIIELGGTTRGSEYDAILADGNLSLGGTLAVSLIDAGFGLFSPTAGDSFEIISAAGGVTAVFAVEELPALTGDLFWTVFYSTDSVVLEVTAPGLPGDFNLNGSVDAADYVVWRKNDGTQQGYNTWRANFGQTAGSGAIVDAAVPEPCSGSIILLAMGILAAGMRSRWRA